MEKKTLLYSINSFFAKFKDDYAFKTVLCSTLSFSFTVLFALYNGFLGIYMRSLWHASISIYYLLLVIIRGIILLTENAVKTKNDEEQRRRRHKTFAASAMMLLLLNISLIFPIATMVKFEKPVNMSLIPAIGMAAYTTYKITMSSINIAKRKTRKHTDILVAELRSINFIDALVSVLTLQNTLIMVNDTQSAENMLALSAVSSALIYLLILAVTVLLIAKVLKRNEK